MGKLFNITVVGINTKKVCIEKRKTRKEASYWNFYFVRENVKSVWFESLKNNKLICYSQPRLDFTNGVKISRYNQPETFLGYNVFSDTPIDTTTADELNCFCGVVDWRGVLSLISSRDYCQRFSPSQISDTPRAVFELSQKLTPSFVEWSYAMVITIPPQPQR